jgi:predicted MFS family arabinose efflux permease
MRRATTAEASAGTTFHAGTRRMNDRARFWRPVVGLGITQIVAWGCVYYPVSVTGPMIAADLGMTLEGVYAAYSALLVASAIVAPRIGRAIDERGGRTILSTGSFVAAVGLVATAAASSPLAYALCSLLLGVAAAMNLYDAAFPALVEATGREGRQAITIVTFAGGFASTLSWPVTAFLAARLGWREIYLIYAGAMLLICLPLHLGVLGRRAAATANEAKTPNAPIDDDAATILTGAVRRRAFIVLAVAIAANQFAASGFLIHAIGFIEQLGLDRTQAIALAMLFGPAQVLGRVGEMLFGRRFPAIVTGRLSAALLPLGLLLVAPGAATLFVAAAFVLFLGLSNGLMTIARGTVSLALFGPVNYGATIGRLTVPSLAARAAGPLAFAISLESLGLRMTVAFGLAAAIVGWLGMEWVAGIERRARQAGIATRA